MPDSQSPKSSLSETVGLEAVLVPLLLSIAKKVRLSQSIALDHLPVVAGQDQLLLLLLKMGTLSVVKLAEGLDVRPSTVSKMIDRCEANGWVHRSKNVDDGRQVKVILTDRGIAMAGEIENNLAALEADIERFVGRDHEAHVALEKMAKVLSRRLHRYR